MPEILIDSMPLEFTLEESKTSPGKYVARGQFARSDQPTENKRLYGPHLWEREIGRLSDSMKGRMVFGELDHPADGRTKLQRVSHILTNLHSEGSEIQGEAEILDTPNGRILKAILDAQGKVGVSSRGFGTTKVVANGVHEVQEDFRLHTFDFVADPAMKTAYPEVFHEETLKIPEDGMELTLEDLKRDYPGLVEALSSEVKTAALTEATERASLLTEVDELLHALLLERHVADGEDLVDQQQFGVDVDRHGERQPDVHPRRVGLDRRVDELFEAGELDDVIEPFVYLPA